MNVRVTSRMCTSPKTVKNLFSINNIDDVDKLCKAVVSDSSAIITRSDGKEVSVVCGGFIHTEVFNQKQLLADWCNLVVDEFPSGGEYTKASI